MTVRIITLLCVFAQFAFGQLASDPGVDNPGGSNNDVTGDLGSLTSGSSSSGTTETDPNKIYYKEFYEKNPELAKITADSKIGSAGVFAFQTENASGIKLDSANAFSAATQADIVKTDTLQAMDKYHPIAVLTVKSSNYGLWLFAILGFVAAAIGIISFMRTGEWAAIHSKISGFVVLCSLGCFVTWIFG